LFATTFVLACSTEAAPPSRTPSTTRAAGTKSGTTKTDDPAEGSVDLGRVKYTPGVLSAVGSVAGNIKLDGPAPADTMTITEDRPIGGTTPQPATLATAKGLSNAVVWIAGVKTGKQLPVEKRADLSSEKCALDPRVQA